MAEKTKVRMAMDDFTLGDIETFEAATGLDLMEVMKPTVVRDEAGRPVKDPDDPKGRPLTEVKMPGKGLIGLVFIAMRHERPDITLAEVKQMRLNDFEFEITQDEEADEEAAGAADPTVPPGESCALPAGNSESVAKSSETSD